MAVMSTLRHVSSTYLATLAALVALTSACTVHDQKTPELSGPSELGLSLMVTASPQLLPRDGGSTAAISVKAFNSNGQPQKRQRLLYEATSGTLSLTDVTTDDNGNAPTVTFVAPGINEAVSSATIFVTPIEANSDARNTNSRTVVIALVGPEVPVPAFTFQPANPAQFEEVTFDASPTRLGVGGVFCGSACSYQWDFGDGSTATGQTAKHRFGSQGVQVVTLTVTSLASGATAARAQSVSVGQPVGPTAELRFSPQDPRTNDVVNFDASASKAANGATIVEYRWNFGGGIGSASTSGPTNTATFPLERTYSVTVTVVDSNGQTATKAVDVAITAP
jgi:PKD repeat protein